MPAKRTTAKVKAAAATERSDRMLKDGASHEVLTALTREWLQIAQLAVEEIQSETAVTIVNAGDQLQRHPAVTVLEAASKRIEALVVLAEQFEQPEDGAGGDMPPPPSGFTPRVVSDAS